MINDVVSFVAPAAVAVGNRGLRPGLVTLVCAGHASTFLRDGTVITAMCSLPRFALLLSGDDVFVDTSIVVGIESRAQ